MDHRYMRPPPPPQAPPPASDPYQRPPPNHPWNYSTQQFQYQPQPQHSPSPPPPPQWVGPPPSSEHAQYPPPPPPPPYVHQPPPYPGNPHYPSPRPPHVPHPYPQDWGYGSWSQHQSWQYPNNANEEDWAAKARAWAAAKASTDNQQPQPQFVSAPRPEGQQYFHNQFSQPVEQYPVEMGPPNGSGLGQSQESHYHGSAQSSFAADMNPSYNANDGSLAGYPVAPFPQHDKSSISPSGRQQEVPSSYSSIAGNDAGNKYEGFNSSSSRPVLQHHVQPQPQYYHLLGSQPAETVADPSDQPLNFAPHFNRNMDPHAQPNYTHSSGGPGVDHTAISSNYAWPPSSAPGGFYPPVATNMSNSGPQVDHPTMFSTGPGFQPTFGVGSGITPHAMTFSGDAYGVSGVSERPKKASVPNWLREEIIKNKAVVTNSTVELSKEDSNSVDDDINDKFSRRDQADSRSMDSFRSTEDEDEEEVEAARTAAINQEIKRILTEVLLKVTDELFDEIATKVLNEDDISIEVGNDTDLSNDQVLPPTQATVTPKSSAKILIPTKTKELDAGDASENSISGNVLGLASYASDEEEDEIQNSDKLQSKENTKYLQSSSDVDLKDHSVLQNGNSREITEEQGNELLKSNDTGGVNDSASKDSQRGFDSSKSNKSVTEKASAERNERPVESSDGIKSGNNDFQTSRIENRLDQNDGHENKKSSASESVKERPGKKGDEENRRQEEKHTIAEKTDKRKEKDRTDEKTKDSESRKRRSPADGKDGVSHTLREKRNRDKDDKDERRRDKTRDEKKERSRHDTVSDSSRRKRHRSPSVDGRDRESKNKSVVGRPNDYIDQSSDDSKRRSHQSKRHKSPSPIKHRKRQVSRSPHSKHSKRRHSPYSSLETTRGKRSLSSSRSRSPVRRRR